MRLYLPEVASCAGVGSGFNLLQVSNANRKARKKKESVLIFHQKMEVENGEPASNKPEGEDPNGNVAGSPPKFRTAPALATTAAPYNHTGCFTTAVDGGQCRILRTF
jgi:hypothetical protein